MKCELPAGQSGEFQGDDTPRASCGHPSQGEASRHTGSAEKEAGTLLGSAGFRGDAGQRERRGSANALAQRHGEPSQACGKTGKGVASYVSQDTPRADQDFRAMAAFGPSAARIIKGALDGVGADLHGLLACRNPTQPPRGFTQRRSWLAVGSIL